MFRPSQMQSNCRASVTVMFEVTLISTSGRWTGTSFGKDQHISILSAVPRSLASCQVLATWTIDSCCSAHETRSTQGKCVEKLRTMVMFQTCEAACWKGSMVQHVVRMSTWAKSKQVAAIPTDHAAPKIGSSQPDFFARILKSEDAGFKILEKERRDKGRNLERNNRVQFDSINLFVITVAQTYDWSVAGKASRQQRSCMLIIYVIVFVACRPCVGWS